MPRGPSSIHIYVNVCISLSLSLSLSLRLRVYPSTDTDTCATYARSCADDPSHGQHGDRLQSGRRAAAPRLQASAPRPPAPRPSPTRVGPLPVRGAMSAEDRESCHQPQQSCNARMMSAYVVLSYPTARLATRQRRVWCRVCATLGPVMSHHTMPHDAISHLIASSRLLLCCVILGHAVFTLCHLIRESPQAPSPPLPFTATSARSGTEKLV